LASRTRSASDGPGFDVSLAQSALGGALIGAGAALLLVALRRVAGISGIASSVVEGDLGESAWRVAFLAGLVLPAILVGLDGPQPEAGLPTLLAAGLLVGIGTRVGSGCTSGHGVCGVANLAPRSIVATLTFMATAIVTVFIVRHGGAP